MTQVRRAGPGDVDLVLSLAEEFAHHDGHAFDRAGYRAALLPLLMDDDLGTVWVVGEAGYAVVTWGWSLESGGREALLDEVYVRDRGEGLGRRLVEAATATARDAGARRLFLETEGPNASARRFYAGLGLVEEDSVWMALDLGVAP